MYAIISAGLLGLVVYWLYNQISGLQRNIAHVKASGLPYHVSLLVSPAPGHLYIAFEPLIIGAMLRIPYLKNSKWPILMTVYRGWTWRDKMVDMLGETFMIVSSTQVYLNTSDPVAITQISSRRSHFIKASEFYEIVDIFGRSIISAEGEEWKRHRKVVAPAFAEKSNVLVWQESLRQAKGMTKYWSKLPGNTKYEMKVQDASVSCAGLALHVISGAGFGVKQVWKGEDEEQLGSSVIPGFNSTKLSKGHTLEFKDALEGLMSGVLWLMLLPRWTLNFSPFEIHKKLMKAHAEVTNYFDELVNYKIDLIEKGNDVDARTMDIMAPMVRASQIDPSDSNALHLTRREVIADSWILLFAGHETTAGTLNFTLIFLAMALDSQHELQSEIDSIVGDRPQEEWTYEKDMGALYNSLVGASFSETLRLMPPVTEVPKVVRPNPQVLRVHGKEHLLPAEMYMHLNGAAVQRNIKYWPHGPSKITPGKSDINDWVPQRWIGTHAPSNGVSKIDDAHDEYDIEKVSFEASSGGLFVPLKGTYIPFADGPRACPGRRFAQVEMTAVLTSLFKTYSIELDVSKYASDEEVEKMNKVERNVIYEKVKADVRKELDKCMITIALKMMTPCPFRIVKRGDERFLDCYV